MENLKRWNNACLKQRPSNSVSNNSFFFLQTTLPTDSTQACQAKLSAANFQTKTGIRCL